MAYHHEIQSRTVFARHENGLFYPVVFCEGPKLTPAGELYHTVVFNNGWLRDVFTHDFIAQDLSNLRSGTRLYLGQRVAVFHNQEEHRGSVIEQIGENVRVRLDLVNQLQVFKIDQLRLSGDVSRPHLGSLDSFQTFLEPKPIVAEIHIPKGKTYRPSPNEKQTLEVDVGDAEDIKAAALALTSLSLSPGLSSADSAKDQFVFPSTTPQDLKMADLRMQVDEGYNDRLLKPRSRSFESPNVVSSRKKRTASLDLNSTSARGQKLQRAESWDTETNNSKGCRSENLNKAFQCMWRGCGRVLASLPGIIRHVKNTHLGPKTKDPVEFYFNDLFVDDASVSSDDSSVSSGIAEDEANGESENDLDDEVLQSNVLSRSAFKTDSGMAENLGNGRSESFPHKTDKLARSKYGRVKMVSGRIRSARDRLGIKGAESAKKCRKVYGMENKKLWCTQCRWKKACVRFGK